MWTTFSRRALIATACLITLGSVAQASTTDYPNRHITLVVPYPAGGNGDNIARVFAKKLGEQFNTPVIVDNKPGASGTIGAGQVHRAAADGYTLLLTVTTQLTSSVPGVKPTYNAVKDFQPLVGLTTNPMAFVVPTSLGVNSMKELEQLSRTRKLSYGSYGTATSTHIVQYLLNQQFGAKDSVHVPYRGESPMVSDMLGGQIDMGLVGIGQAREMQKSGRMRTLGILGMQRSEFMPGVPTLTEQGYKSMNWAYGVALYGATKLPAPVVAKLQEAGHVIMAAEDTQQQFRNQSNEPWVGVTPKALAELMVKDTNNWNKVLADVGAIE